MQILLLALSSIAFAQDTDGDGYTRATGDCNDRSAAIHPGQPEVCNAVDDDCDRFVDEGLQRSWYRDDDGDGYGADADRVRSCRAVAGYSLLREDCDDGDAATYPTAEETCGDGVDHNCDGYDCTSADALTGDGYLGWAFDASGDLDGDGVNDLLASSPVDASFAAIYPGPVRAAMGAPATTMTNGSYGVGLSLLAEDVSGDGADDAVIASYAGVYVLRGPVASGTVDLASADATFTGAYAEYLLGMAASPDLDGDGAPDLVLPANGLYVVPGDTVGATSLAAAATATISRVSGDPLLGDSLDASHDVNGDGVADLIAGTRSRDDGSILGRETFVYHGPLTGNQLLADADLTLVADRLTTIGGLGWQATGTGDTDGDGLDDVAATDASNLLIFSGLGTGTYTSADATTRYLRAVSASAYMYREGHAIADGDFNGDGALDIAVGSAIDVDGYEARGSTRVYYGPGRGTVDTEEADLSLKGSSASAWMGHAVGNAGDVDGSGADALLVTELGREGMSVGNAAVHLLFGGDAP